MLAELLAKRERQEQLTEDEIAILSEYDKRVEEATKALQEKYSNLENEVKGKSDLEKRIEELNSKSKDTQEELERIRKEKEELEKQVQEAGNIEDIRASLRKALEDKQALELEREKEKQARILKEKEDTLNSKILELEKQLQEQSKQNEISNFKQELMQEKSKRPYLINQLDKIFNEIETKGVQQSKMILNFLLESINHDEEMESFNRKSSAGTSILEKKEVKVNEKNSFEEFLKRKPNLR